MDVNESDKEQICNLCREALSLERDRFNELIKELSNSSDPVVMNLCNFLKRKKGA